MRRRGIEHLFYLQVDNPLTPICDAEFIGYHLLANSELTSMAVPKQTPQDRVGVFAMIDDQMQVIEYSDLPDDVAAEREASGSLKFWAGSIAVHVFGVAFLERAWRSKMRCRFISHGRRCRLLMRSATLVQPKEPNALKFERFIFDLLPHAKNALVVEFEEREVLRRLRMRREQSAIRRSTCSGISLEQHRRWLEAAGTRVCGWGRTSRLVRCGRWMRRGWRVAATDHRRIDRATYLQAS